MVTPWRTSDPCRAGLLAIVILGSHATGAATPQQEIDAQVWRPMLQASDAFDAEGFLAVVSPQLIRVSRRDGRVEGHASYAANIRAGFQRARQRTGLSRHTELAFLERHASADSAFETGYFRSTVTLPDGTQRVSYTAFTFVLRREDGRWRILVDADSDEGGTITETRYRAARPLEPGD